MTTWNWQQRIDAMMEALHSSDATIVRLAERGAPATEEEIAEVHRAIGFELDSRFLDFFRVCNGLRLIWVASHLPADDDPVVHFHDQIELASCGRINVPSLHEMFVESPGYLFGPDMVAPKDNTVECLGGWDEHALRIALRDIDDYLQLPDDSSFFLPGLVASPRYPDPPLIMTSDYVACLDDRQPMLAREYLAMIVATLGQPGARERMKNRGAGGNHELFVAPAGWLDDAPSAAQILAAVHDQVSLEENQAIRAKLAAIVEGEGAPLSQTPYAHYNA